MSTKRTSSPKPRRRSSSGERAEYTFDYSKAKPNRFAGRFGSGALVITLDPDVAAVFNTSESVNALLRSVIAAVPASGGRTSSRRAG